MPTLADRRTAMIEGLLSNPELPQMSPEVPWWALEAQPQQGMIQRAKNVAGLADPYNWIKAIATMPNIATEQGMAEAKEFTSSYEDMFDVAMNAPMGLLGMVKTATGGTLAKRNLKGQRHSVAANTVRNLDQQDMLAAAKRGVHLKQDPKTGQYIGAPRGVDSPAKLAQIRRNFDVLVEAGAGGGDWYDRVLKAANEITGGDQARTRRLLNELAITSPQAMPESNLGFALQGHNAYEAGVPAERMRTGAIARNYNAARNAGRLAKTGPKTGVYEENMASGGRALVPTNDIWHARSFGYVGDNGKAFSRGLSDTEHAFLDAETMLAVQRANARKLGGRSDWTVGEVQAAPWVKQRADKVFKDKKGALSWAEAFDEANKTYPDYFAKHTAFGTYESMPGVSTGVLPGLFNANEATRAAYAADPRSTWATAPGGRDALYDELGMYVRPTADATGVYTPPGGKLETNPAQVARPLVSFTPSVKGVKGVMPADSAMLDMTEGLRGYIDAQGAGAWSKPIVQIKARANSSGLFSTSGPVTAEQLQQLKELVQPYGLEPISYGNEILLANFGDKVADGTQLNKILKGSKKGKQRGLTAQIGDIFGPDTVVQRVDKNTGYLGYEGAQTIGPTQPGSAPVTRQLLEYLDAAGQAAPGALAKLEQSAVPGQMAASRLQRDADWALQLGQQGLSGYVNPAYQNARRILSETGLPGLRQALQEGKTYLPALAPAAMLPAWLYGLGPQDQTTI